MEDRTSPGGGTSLAIGHELLWYKIEGLLGRGGFGLTYLARDKNLERDVAIKEYLPTMFAVRHPDYTVTPLTGAHGDNFKWGLDSFLKEAQTLARFKHKNIVQVQTVFEHYGTAYMVMEYELGESLATLMKNGETVMDQPFFENILFPIMDGLQLIHDAGFIHRDIKPANIYIREDHSPVLIDFGSARQTSVQTTGEMTALVSQGYTPLEQYSPNFGNQGPWTDIYALAASVYHAATGKMADDALNRCASTQSGKPDPLKPFSSIAGPGFSNEFVHAIDQGLILSLSDRPQSLSEWKAFFESGNDKTVIRPIRSALADVSDKTVVMPLGGLNRSVPGDSFRRRAADDDRTTLMPMGQTAPLGSVPADASDRTVVMPIGGGVQPGDQSLRVHTTRDPGSGGGDHTVVMPLGGPGPRPADSTTHRAANDQQSPAAKKDTSKGLSWLVPVAVSCVVLIAAAGGGWWYYHQRELERAIESGLAVSVIDALPRPDISLQLESPIDRLRTEVQSIGSLATIYANALAIDASSEEARQGMNYVVQRYLRLAAFPLINADPALGQSILDGLRLAGADQEPRVADAISSLQSGGASMDTTQIETLLAKESMDASDRENLIFAFASLPQPARQKLASNPRVVELSTTFKKSIIEKLQESEFDNAARMIELALVVTPDDRDLKTLRAYLEQ